MWNLSPGLEVLPAAFLAMTSQWYAVPGVRPLRMHVFLTPAVPEPALRLAVVWVKGHLVPHRNQ